MMFLPGAIDSRSAFALASPRNSLSEVKLVTTPSAEPGAVNCFQGTVIRAIYFGDDVYIGYVPGAPVMEISTVAPKLGGTFYFIEQEKLRKPKFVRSATDSHTHRHRR